MNNENISAIYRATDTTGVFDGAALRYMDRVYPGAGTPSLRNRIAQALRDAGLDTLRRGGKYLAEYYDNNAETLDKAVLVLTRDVAEDVPVNRHFLSLMSSGDGYACALRAVESLKEMAASFRRNAKLYGRDNNGMTFFYAVGRRFRDSGLDRPMPQEAYEVYATLMRKVHELDPPSANGFKDYDPANSSQLSNLIGTGFDSDR